MATIEQWAEVLSVAAGPWKREEMRELATDVLETLLIEAADSTLRAVRQELRSELRACTPADGPTAPLLRALARISRLGPEVAAGDAAHATVTLPRPEPAVAAPAWPG